MPKYKVLAFNRCAWHLGQITQRYRAKDPQKARKMAQADGLEVCEIFRKRLCRGWIPISAN